MRGAGGEGRERWEEEGAVGGGGGDEEGGGSWGGTGEEEGAVRWGGGVTEMEKPGMRVVGATHFGKSPPGL